MNATDRAVISWECERLIHHYAQLSDAGDFHAVAELFTRTAVFARPTDAANLVLGRDAILQMFLARPPRFTRHLISTVVITVVDAGYATGHSYLSLHTGKLSETLPAPADPVFLIGAFHDRFEREDGVWKFSERRGSLALKAGDPA